MGHETDIHKSENLSKIKKKTYKHRFQFIIYHNTGFVYIVNKWTGMNLCHIYYLSLNNFSVFTTIILFLIKITLYAKHELGTLN